MVQMAPTDSTPHMFEMYHMSIKRLVAVQCCNESHYREYIIITIIQHLYNAVFTGVLRVPYKSHVTKHVSINTRHTKTLEKTAVTL